MRDFLLCWTFCIRRMPVLMTSQVPDDTATVALEKPADGGKARLLTLGDLDGRTNSARQARALIAAIEDDLGGADRLSASERVLAARAGVATAMIEHLEAVWLSGRGLDVGAYSTLLNSVTRTLRTLGLKRQPRDITPNLADYVAERATDSAPADAPATQAAPAPGKRTGGRKAKPQGLEVDSQSTANCYVMPPPPC
jgi:hypothetical protein